MDTRDKLIEEINVGSDTDVAVNNSKKNILTRGCDPEMARRASKIMPPMLGNPKMVAVTNDDDFLEELQKQKWNIILFAPGACRYDAVNSPIPGGVLQTVGWGLKEYRSLVQKHQGDDIIIVETPDERQVVPLLKKALQRIK